MPRAFHPRSSPRERLQFLVRLASALGCCTLLIVKTQAGTGSPGSSGEPGPAAAAAAVVGSAAVGNRALSPVDSEPRVQEDPPRPLRSIKPRRALSATRSGGSDAWYWEMGVITLVLAVCGGLVAAARRFLPQAGAGGLQIIARVSLSPKHSVYMLRAGRRVLLVGAGPQGAPALITELDDLPESEPSPPRGEEP